MDDVIELQGISKVFDGRYVNKDIDFTLKRGEIHALLGENGAGKSTLMNILFGLYKPDAGQIIINGQECRIDSPKAAAALGIGMVHQHFKLVESFSVAENIMLGLEATKYGMLDLAAVCERILSISEQHGLALEPAAKIESLSVGMQQRVEIMKMLYREADILIFDEPTAMLTPQETEELLKIMRNMADAGKSIILITHKLKEIKTVADRCTIIRRGAVIDTVNVADCSREQMAELMVGRQINFNINKSERRVQHVMLSIQDLNVDNINGVALMKNFSLDIQAGEIVGIAGVSGNGQLELVETIVGVRKQSSGRILLNDIEISHMSIRQRIMLGIAHIPEDRHKTGLILDYNLEANSVLSLYVWPPFSDKRGVLHKDKIADYARHIVDKFDVRSNRGTKSLARDLSGGNQQKLIIGREITREPDLLIAVQPTRGLDIGSIVYVHEKLIEQRNTGKGVLLISAELDELLDITDRIAVINSGELMGVVNTKETSERELGRMMAGIRELRSKD